MIKICAKNYEFVENNDQFIIEDDGFKGINIFGEQFFLNRIPCICCADEYDIYFMSKAMSDYIILDYMENQFYQLAVEIKKRIVNDEPTIVGIDITMLVSEKSFLSCFINKNRNGLEKILTTKLPILFEVLPYSKNEKEWLENKLKNLPFKNELEKPTETNVKKNHIGAKPTKYYDVFGEKLTVREMSDKYGIRQDTLRARLDKGMSVEEAVTMKVQETGWRLRK